MNDKLFCRSIPVHFNLFWQLKCKQFKFQWTTHGVFTPVSWALASWSNKFSLFSTFWPHVSKISQNIYLDLSELNEILYLGSRDVYLSHLNGIKIRQLEVSKQYDFVYKNVFFCKILLAKIVNLRRSQLQFFTLLPK